MALDKKTKLAIGFLIVAIIIAVICGLVFGLKSSTPEPVKPILSLELRPKSKESNTTVASIRYDIKNPTSIKYYVDDIDKFLETYRNVSYKPNIMQCDFDQFPVAAGKVCNVDIDTLVPPSCKPENNYGYNKSTPCIFLTLTKITDWYPEVYNDSKNLPQEMPNDLKAHITNSKKTNMIWLSCEGVNATDVLNMGPTQYYPRRGYPAHYFPFNNIDGYMSPVVSVLFEKPKIGVQIHIVCKTWAKNIYTNTTEKMGVANFELLIN